MTASVRRLSRIASAAAREIAAHQREVAGLDRNVGAGAHGDAEVGLGERGRVVDAVADHGDDATLRLQPGDGGHLVGRQHIGDHIVVGYPDLRLRRPAPSADCRRSAASGAGRASATRVETGDAAGLDGVGHDDQADASIADATVTTVRPSASWRAFAADSGLHRRDPTRTAGRRSCHWHRRRPGSTTSRPRRRSRAVRAASRSIAAAIGCSLPASTAAAIAQHIVGDEIRRGDHVDDAHDDRW